MRNRVTHVSPYSPSVKSEAENGRWTLAYIPFIPRTDRGKGREVDVFIFYTRIDKTIT